MAEKPKHGRSTEAVHAGIPKQRPAHTLTPSIAQTATYTFEDTADLERYMRGEDPDPEREEYGRYGNPTVRELERRVAALEGADDAVAFASGMGATTSVLLALLKAGDHVERVFYPGLSSHPSHTVAARQMRGFGGVVSLIVKGGRAAASRVMDGCQLARIAPSLGGVETLIEQPAIMSFFELSTAELREIGIDPGLIRLSLGVEDAEDVLDDLSRALERA
jgi:cystathionine beta-lyase/cystathionine gamma-synthase